MTPRGMPVAGAEVTHAPRGGGAYPQEYHHHHHHDLDSSTRPPTHMSVAAQDKLQKTGTRRNEKKLQYSLAKVGADGLEGTMVPVDDAGAAPVHRTAQQMYLQDHVTRMQADIEATTKRLELEKRRLNKLEEDVQRMRAEHEEKVLKVAPRQEGPPVRKLEHRLAKAISQLNGINAENAQVRAKIDSTRRERMQMNQIFKKLQGEIKENITQVGQLQRDTDLARKEMEERQNKMSALKKQLELERKQFKETAQGLQKEMKDREREELTQRVLTLKDAENSDDKRKKTRSLKADEEENFNSVAVMRRILKLAFLNSIQRRHIKQHQKNIEVFEQAFATIKSTTGISDIEEIVKIFMALEQRNFSLLTYVNMLNREIETFEKSNRELEDELRSQKRREESTEKTRVDAVSDIILKIKSTQKATEENLLQARQQAEIVERCQPLIESVMRTIEKENRGFGGPAAPEMTGESNTSLAWLTYIEKTLTQWKDFLPDTKDSRGRQPNKNYKYTVGNQVLALQPKKHNGTPTSLVKPSDLPSASFAFAEAGGGAGQQRGAWVGREDDSSDEEDDLQSHPWTRRELFDKAVASVAKRKKHRKTDAPGQSAVKDAGDLHPPPRGGGGAAAAEAEASSSGGGGTAAAAAEALAALGETQGELGYEDMVGKQREGDDEASEGGDSVFDDDIGPTDEEINEIFLKRYKMNKEELQAMADKMGIQLNNLCYLKQEFDAYDEDRSGYIDVKELKGLLQKLGEELSDDELDQAFRELDSDGSGEIEFFEFVEWFTSED